MWLVTSPKKDYYPNMVRKETSAAATTRSTGASGSARSAGGVALPGAERDHRDLVEPGLRTFFRIAERWRLDNEQCRVLLGAPARSTYFRWKQGDVGTVSRDLVERLSYLLGIYKALQILLPNPDHADGWLHRANSAPIFSGDPPLARMLAGQVADLYVVRQYLDGERGG